jgi:hypothetical protein
MPKFDAGTVVEPLDYDFTTVKGYPHHKAKGLIPEPSEKQIASFIGSLRDLMKDAGAMVDGGDAEDIANPMAFLKQLDSYDPAKFLDLYAGMSTAYADLCSGNPSVEEISALPLRVRLRFFAWLMEEVVSPEAGPGAGIAVVTPLRSAAAG